MTRRFALTAVLLLAAAAAADLAAQTAEGDGVDPSMLAVSYGFGQSAAAAGYLFGEDLPLVMFGGRGGGYLDRSGRLYLGGGGRGGFSVNGEGGGLGYGFLMIGHRGPLSGGSLGLDVYGGPAVGGYGDEEDGDWMAGLAAGVALYLGADRSMDYGLFIDGMVNVIDFERSLVAVGLHVGGKSGSVYVPWERRRRTLSP